MVWLNDVCRLGGKAPWGWRSCVGPSVAASVILLSRNSLAICRVQGRVMIPCAVDFVLVLYLPRALEKKAGVTLDVAVAVNAQS